MGMHAADDPGPDVVCRAADPAAPPVPTTLRPPRLVSPPSLARLGPSLRHRLLPRIALAAVACAALACRKSDGAASAGQKLVLTGSSTIAPLASEIGKRFEQQHPGVRVDVQTGGSSRGVADARSGLADIGMVSRSLKPDETDLHPVLIGRDGISVTLNTRNPVRALTDSQVVAIYTGRITNWKQVGGQDAPITVVNKAEGRSTLELFLNYYKLKNRDVKAQVIIGDNEQEVKTIAGNPNAIGYVSIGTAEYESARNTPIRLLPMNGIVATSANVAARTFPLSRDLNLITKSAAPTGLAKQFLDFAASPAVQDLVKGQFFVPPSS